MAIKTFSKRVSHVHRPSAYRSARESLSHDLQQWTWGYSSRCRRRHRPRLLVNHKLIIRICRRRRFESQKPCVATTFALHPQPIHPISDGFLTTFDTSRRTNVYISCATLIVDDDDDDRGACFGPCPYDRLQVCRGKKISPTTPRPSSPTSRTRHHRSQPREPPLHPAPR